MSDPADGDPRLGGWDALPVRGPGLEQFAPAPRAAGGRVAPPTHDTGRPTQETGSSVHDYPRGRDYEYDYDRDHDRDHKHDRDYDHDYAPAAARTRPAPAAEHWYDDEAGPLVRLYAVTGGRAARSRHQVFDLVALVSAESSARDNPTLSPEQAAVLDLCRPVPRSVAELTAACGLPLGVVRVLLGDLLEVGHIRVRRPAPAAELFDEGILREVINGLRAL